uniref:Large subunit ribosomal protein L46, mitochondrial n=1 Tax=Tetraselmis sp. GSL018 TaxID=582737 RepID=A0A061S2J6_9CHLO
MSRSILLSLWPRCKQGVPAYLAHSSWIPGEQAVFSFLSYGWKSFVTSGSNLKSNPIFFNGDSAPNLTSGGRIISSLVVERLPIVTPEEEPWETEYREWQARVRRRRKELPPELTEVDKGTAEDTGREEESWKPASRTTEADTSGDVRTTWRRLDRRLFLLVKDRETGEWGFPSTEHRDGETIRATAERNMQLTVGDVKCYFVGNAPCAHFRQPSGDTQFFSKVQLLQWEAKPASSTAAEDFVWVTREEVKEYISDEKLQALAADMLSP